MVNIEESEQKLAEAKNSAVDGAEKEMIESHEEDKKRKISCLEEEMKADDSTSGLKTVDICDIDRNVDCLFLVVNSQELKAAEISCELTHRTTFDKVWYYYGSFCGKRVVVVQQSEQGTGGTGKSQETVTKALETWSPQFVFGVGVGFGFNSAYQKLGDVLISKGILPYEWVRVGEKKVENRNRLEVVSDEMMALFDGVQDNEGLNPVDEFKVHIGIVLSGEKLVDSRKMKEELRDLFSLTSKDKMNGIKVVGGEMEGHGVITACKDKGGVPCVIIKGICDFAQDKADLHQQKQQRNHIQITAACNAFKVLSQVLTNNWPYKAHHHLFLSNNAPTIVDPNHQFYPKLHALVDSKLEADLCTKSEQYKRRKAQVEATFAQAKREYERSIKDINQKQDLFNQLANEISKDWKSTFPSSIIKLVDEKQKEVAVIKANKRNQRISWSKKAIQRFLPPTTLQRIEEELRPPPKVAISVKPNVEEA